MITPAPARYGIQIVNLDPTLNLNFTLCITPGALSLEGTQAMVRDCLSSLKTCLAEPDAKFEDAQISEYVWFAWYQVGYKTYHWQIDILPGSLKYC